MTTVPESRLRQSSQVILLAVIGFIAGQLIAIVLDSVVISIAHIHGGVKVLTAPSPPWWSTVVGLVGLWAGLAGAVVIGYRRGVVAPWPNAWRVRPSDAAYLLLGVALQIGVALAYLPFHLAHLSQPVHKIFDSSQGPTFVVLAALTAFGAPFFEEWFFRGLIFRGLLGENPTKRVVVVATIVSAALFALAHGEPLQLPGLFAVGLVLATVLYRTRRIVPSIATHCGFNTLALVSLVVQRAHS